MKEDAIYIEEQVPIIIPNKKTKEKLYKLSPEPINKDITTNIVKKDVNNVRDKV